MKLKTIFGSIALLCAMSPLANAQMPPPHSDRGGPMVTHPGARNDRIVRNDRYVHRAPPRHRMYRCRNGSLRNSPAACRRHGGYRR